MRILFASIFMLISMQSLGDELISASGVLYFELDMASPDKADGVNFAKFVPDSKSLSKFSAVTTGDRPSPVKYISFEPAEKILEKTLGPAEANRISHGRENIIQTPVKLVLRDFGSEIECDSRVYYGTLVSVTTLKTYQVAINEDVPRGC